MRASILQSLKSHEAVTIAGDTTGQAEVQASYAGDYALTLRLELVDEPATVLAGLALLFPEVANPPIC